MQVVIGYTYIVADSSSCWICRNMDDFMRWEERRWTWEGLKLRYWPPCCKLPRLTTFYWSLTFLKIFFKPNWGNKTYSFSGVNFIATDIHWRKAVISSTPRLKKMKILNIYIKTRTQLENFSRVAKTMKRMNSSPVFSKLTLSSRSKLFFSVWDCPFTAERMKR